MRGKITILVLFITSFGFAQNDISYKAIVKDDLGNVVANQSINVRFTLETLGVGIYQEEHTTLTDDNGLIILNIGEGTVLSGVFDDVPWATDPIDLNVQVDIGDGLVNMGTTAFKAVPYAITALSLAPNAVALNDMSDGKSDENGSSLFLGVNSGTNDDGNNRNVGIGYNSLSSNTSGYRNTANGYHALSDNTTGYGNTASGYYALYRNTTGIRNTAEGYFALYSNTTGDYNSATGYNALFANNTGSYNSAYGNEALRNNTIGNNNTAIGRQSLYNNLGGVWNTASGMQASQNNSNGSFNTTVGGLSLLHNDNGNWNTSLGFGAGEYVNGSNNTFVGYRAGSRSTASTRTMSGSVFIGNQAGYNETNNNRLYIDNSNTTDPLVYGEFDNNLLRVNGDFRVNTNSVNPLRINTSSSDNFLSFYTNNIYKGYVGVFNGNNDMDFGTGAFNLNGKTHLVTRAIPRLTINADGEIGIGTEDPTSDLHVIGNARITDALTLDGTLSVSGNIIAFQELHAENGISFDAGAKLNTNYFDSSVQITVNTHFIPFVDNDLTLGISSRRWSSVWSVDGSINTSDRRDKTNITDLNYGLKEIMRLKPKKFNWKTKPNKDTKLGLIAQDLLKIIPEVVKTHSPTNEDLNNLNQTKEEAKRLGVYYSDLIPVLIKGIQDQQKIIENQQKQIDELKQLVLNKLNTK